MKKIAIICFILIFSNFIVATEYVLQIITANNKLIKSYTVTEQCPIRETVPEGRIQIVTTNTTVFEEIRNHYKVNPNTEFNYDPETGIISWE